MVRDRKFIVIVFLAASVLTTVVTFLKRIYFLVGMTLVVLFLALLKLDILGVFGKRLEMLVFTNSNMNSM